MMMMVMGMGENKNQMDAGYVNSSFHNHSHAKDRVAVKPSQDE